MAPQNAGDKGQPQPNSSNVTTFVALAPDFRDILRKVTSIPNINSFLSRNGNADYPGLYLAAEELRNQCRQELENLQEGSGGCSIRSEVRRPVISVKEMRHELESATEARREQIPRYLPDSTSADGQRWTPRDIDRDSALSRKERPTTPEGKRTDSTPEPEQFADPMEIPPEWTLRQNGVRSSMGHLGPNIGHQLTAQGRLISFFTDREAQEHESVLLPALGPYLPPRRPSFRRRWTLTMDPYPDYVRSFIPGNYHQAVFLYRNPSMGEEDCAGRNLRRGLAQNGYFLSPAESESDDELPRPSASENNDRAPLEGHLTEMAEKRSLPPGTKYCTTLLRPDEPGLSSRSHPTSATPPRDERPSSTPIQAPPLPEAQKVPGKLGKKKRAQLKKAAKAALPLTTESIEHYGTPTPLSGSTLTRDCLSTLDRQLTAAARSPPHQLRRIPTPERLLPPSYEHVMEVNELARQRYEQDQLQRVIEESQGRDWEALAAPRQGTRSLLQDQEDNYDITPALGPEITVREIIQQASTNRFGSSGTRLGAERAVTIVDLDTEMRVKSVAASLVESEEEMNSDEANNSESNGTSCDNAGSEEKGDNAGQNMNTEEAEEDGDIKSDDQAQLVAVVDE